eukprot:TRINITY_DN7991_c0_g1_i2.p1 TRINITY_DN7991_c0_g1~~TRINITY_DN7991_c0_g1_i2.p1  ORF type:complete len:198 (+),score=52.49 TRINITY_DN7991_c0_g1_i2:146-739(+)
MLAAALQAKEEVRQKLLPAGEGFVKVSTYEGDIKEIKSDIAGLKKSVKSIEGRMDRMEDYVQKLAGQIEAWLKAQRKRVQTETSRKNARAANDTIRSLNRDRKEGFIPLRKEEPGHMGSLSPWLASRLKVPAAEVAGYKLEVFTECPKQLHAAFEENNPNHCHAVCNAFAWFYNESFGVPSDDPDYRRDKIIRFLTR